MRYRTGVRVALAALLLCLSLTARSPAQNQVTSITLSNNQVALQWNCRGALEVADEISGPWTPVPGAHSPYTNLATNDHRFYRINQTVDTTTLHKKVMCGYQGWFRCPGDGTNLWIHWSRDSSQITSNTLTVDMWPDMTEYSAGERYNAGTFTYPGGAQAQLFSSQNQLTVDRHFDWMRQYGIDGVFVQRFVTDINGRPWMTNVLNYARSAANRTGRAFALTYDMTSAPTNTLVNVMTNDWNWLVNTAHLTDDPRYLHHNGKPVLMIYGFFHDRMKTNLAHQVIDAFKTNTTLVGGCFWEWRTDSTAGWSNVFRSFDVILPWNTGNYTQVGTNRFATTNYWPVDIAAANAAGMLYLPDIWPGFSWVNLNGTTNNSVPRLGGQVLWNQFYAAATNGLDMAYVGMFDEVDESTAIFKVTNTPPPQGYFVTYEGYPSDWYLRLAAEGSKMLAGESPITPTIPITP
ncbi:MAG TPA: glycoside hydrolase family 71/99-like protein [Verrucomicrobiae bacterium]|nr:glycoside hydrolase family 71/99-like protein [Verrucomicrobiae bacterium]